MSTSYHPPAALLLFFFVFPLKWLQLKFRFCLTRKHILYIYLPRKNKPFPVVKWLLHRERPCRSSTEVLSSCFQSVFRHQWSAFQKVKSSPWWDCSESCVSWPVFVHVNADSRSADTAAPTLKFIAFHWDMLWYHLAEFRFLIFREYNKMFAFFVYL